MKNFYLFVVAVFLCSSLSTKASTADFFTYDETALSTQMTDLSQLEAYVKDHSGITLHELTALNLDVVEKIKLSGPLDYSNTLFGFEDINWTSFVWGFCCWPIGIFTVILDKDEDQNSKISYFIGIGTAFILSGTSYGVRSVFWY